MSDNVQEMPTKGMTPEKLLEQAKTKLRQDALNGYKNKIAEKQKAILDANKVLTNAKNDLDLLLKEMAQEISTLDEALG